MADRIGEGYHTDGSANYQGTDLATTVAVGTGLSLITIIAMVLFTNTAAAGFASWAYTTAWGAPFTGLIVFGVGLTAARYYGMKAVANGNLIVATAASILAILTYGSFGSMILSMYASEIWLEAIVITGGITVGITAIASTYVNISDRDLSHFAGISGGLMIVGIIVYLLYTMISWTPLALLGFGAILLGFICDLVYEIWATSNSQRSPIANGFGIYIAFTGVFVHILQWVLIALGEN